MPRLLLAWLGRSTARAVAGPGPRPARGPHPAEIAELHPDPAVIEFLEHGWWRPDQIVARLDEAGFDLAGLTAPVTGAGDPVVTCCRACGRLSAERMGTSVLAARAHATNAQQARTGAVGRLGRPLLGLVGQRTEQRGRPRNCDPAGPPFGSLVGPLWGTGSTRLLRACPFPTPNMPIGSVQARTGRERAPGCAHRPRRSELAQAWADEANPASVSAAAGSLHRFCCPNGHHPRISPRTFLRNGCPHCRADLTRGSGPTLAVAQPEIALPVASRAEWCADTERRRSRLPTDCVGGSLTAAGMNGGRPYKIVTSTGGGVARVVAPSWTPGLAEPRPRLRMESRQPVSPWQVRPHTSTSFTPQWCARRTPATWRAPLSSRSSGAGCPECRISGKSAVEYIHFRAAAEVFGSARSGMVLRDDASRGEYMDGRHRGRPGRPAAHHRV